MRKDGERGANFDDELDAKVCPLWYRQSKSSQYPHHTCRVFSYHQLCSIRSYVESIPSLGLPSPLPSFVVTFGPSALRTAGGTVAGPFDCSEED